MSRWLRPIVIAAAALAVVPATALSYSEKGGDRDRNGKSHHGKKGHRGEDTARYILPPGNFGGLPTNAELDRPAAALRRAHAAARQRHRGATSTGCSCRRTSSPSARPGRSRRAGPGCGSSTTATASRTCMARLAPTWPSARAGRPPATAACCYGSVADRRGPRWPTCRTSTPSASITSGQSFVPSPQAEALVTRQRKLLVKTYGAKGRQIIGRRPGLRRGRQRLLEGQQHRRAAVHRERRDRGDRLHRVDLRRRGRRRGEQRAICWPGCRQGWAGARHKAWKDVMLANDPEAPTTIKRRFATGR